MVRNENTFNANNDDSAAAKKRRALRNKERLFNHQIKLLELFADGVAFGYTDENWSNLTKIYNQVSDFLVPAERVLLGNIWRNTYTENVSPTMIYGAVDAIKARLANPAKSPF